MHHYISISSSAILCINRVPNRLVETKRYTNTSPKLHEADQFRTKTSRDSHLLYSLPTTGVVILLLMFVIRSILPQTRSKIGHTKATVHQHTAFLLPQDTFRNQTIKPILKLKKKCNTKSVSCAD